jgi:sporulation protein YlmC with PRC-barrel domain
MRTLVALIACGLWFATADRIQAQEIRGEQSADQTAKSEADRGLAFRASSIQAMTVRNLQGEELGEVTEVIVDAKTGKIRYVTVSVGGFLGLGDRLVAIPWEKLDIRRVTDSGLGQDEFQLVTNMTRERLEKAPSVERNDWDLFSDEDYTRRIDEYYPKEPRVAEEPDETPVR